MNHPARFARLEALADQIEIGDAVDLVVIGDAGVAIAEADLGPHIDLDCAGAGFSLAAEGTAGRPGIARIGPGDLPPVRIGAARLLRAHLMIGRDAGECAEGQGSDQDGKPTAHSSGLRTMKAVIARSNATKQSRAR